MLNRIEQEEAVMICTSKRTWALRFICILCPGTRVLVRMLGHAQFRGQSGYILAKTPLTRSVDGLIAANGRAFIHLI